MKAENIYLRIAFDFTDKQGNPIGENFIYNTAHAIPLNVDSKELSHRESLIVNSTIADMVVELIQSGQINHLCPQIQDTNPKEQEGKVCSTAQQWIPVVAFDAQIVDKEQTFQSGSSQGKMLLEKWGGSFPPVRETLENINKLHSIEDINRFKKIKRA